MVILELIFKHLIVNLLSLMMLWYILRMINANRSLGHISLVINWTIRSRRRVVLNLINKSLMLWIDSLDPMMKLLHFILMMIDLMMLNNLGMLICQLILCRVHWESLIWHLNRHVLLWRDALWWAWRPDWMWIVTERLAERMITR
jgi:hypothetical protein